MRRWTLLMAGLAMAVILGLPAVAHATPSAGQHVKPGGKWTVEVNHGGCEIETIDTGNMFSADLYGDAGTYTGGGSTIAEKWTQGSAAGFTFSGTWSKAAKTYTGSFTVMGHVIPGQLVKGVVATWNGNSC